MKNQELENLDNLDHEDEISIFDADEPVISTSKSWRIFDKALHLYERSGLKSVWKRLTLESNVFDFRTFQSFLELASHFFRR